MTKKYVRSHEPIVWSLFGGGGMVAAFLTPAVILIIGLLIPLGIMDPELLSYERIHAFAANWIGKLIILAVLALPMWHGMHRIYHGMHDLGIHSYRSLFYWLCYGLAALVSLLAIVELLKI